MQIGLFLETLMCFKFTRSKSGDEVYNLLDIKTKKT